MRPQGARRDLPFEIPTEFWAVPAADLLSCLCTVETGLRSEEAARRLSHYGANRIATQSRSPAWQLLLSQFGSPLVLILVFAAAISSIVGEIHDAVTIGIIILASCGLGFMQEYRATRAMDALKQSISRRAMVWRDGQVKEIAADMVVPGDILELSAGTLIAADCLLLKATDFNVSEAALTGETFPVQKMPGLSEGTATLSHRNNAIYCGTTVRSGTASALVVKTGAATEFAGIAAAVGREYPQTQFARGIRDFGTLMTEVMLVIVVVVFVINLFLGRPLTGSLLFSLALAVGLAPELLPAIISVTLADGARKMSKSGVIVRRLESIENLGSMDTLCTDKTGTLTEGVVRLDSALGIEGNASENVRRWAYLNASLQTGMANPIDEAIIRDVGDPNASLPQKKAEIPYDFVRKRLSVAIRTEDRKIQLICKGAVKAVLAVCTTVQTISGVENIDAASLEDIENRFRSWSADGYRVLAIATRDMDDGPWQGRDEETGMCLQGFLLFFDPPKAGVSDAVRALSQRGINVKIISGDNRHVAAHVASAIGFATHRILTGEQVSQMTKSALVAVAFRTDVFAEIDPNQKERIIAALQQRRHVVGYLGDGINDAPALQEADVGISVDSAVDVAREAADIVLLKRDLNVLIQGIDNGRRTFANTMKYIATTTSSNFGNMVSMAAASVFLPFLPLLAKQILLNNLMADIPSLAIASDNVDPDAIDKAHHWDIAYVRRFMISFGLASSIFDFVTFGFLIFVAQATEATFQTAWFVESLLSELAILLTIRTARHFWTSRPGPILATLAAVMAIVALCIPYLPIAGWFGFVPIPWWILASLVTITVAYVFFCELIKTIVFRRTA